MGTFWSDKVRPADIGLADKLFYGSGLIVGDYHVLIQPEIYNRLNLSAARDKPMQFNDLPRITEINVEKNMTDWNVNSMRYYSLRNVASFTGWFYLLRREPVKPRRGENAWKIGDFQWNYSESNFTLDKPGKKRFVYSGWSKQLDNGTKKENVRYFVDIEVNTTDSLVPWKAQFYKIDAATKGGGFCNDYTESGSLIMSYTDGKDFGVEYITVYDPTRPRSPDCSGKITAIKMPPWRNTLKRLIYDDRLKRPIFFSG